MGERALSKLQWGKANPAAHGTAVAADTWLYAAPISIDPDRRPEYPQDMSGTRARAARSVIYEYLVRNTLKFDRDHPAYFQILPMLFSCGLKGNVTATETTGSQGDYLWTFTPSLTASNAPDSITLEAGDDVQAYETEYVMFERYKISGEAAQDGGAAPVMIDADFFGRQWSTASFTGSISLPTTEIMNAKLSQFYLDTAWASVGGTEKAATMRAFDIEIMTGVHPRFTGSGDRLFTAYGESYIDVMANYIFEGNAIADAIWDAMNAETLQVLRTTVTGSRIGTGTYHKLTIDIGGTWESVTPLGGEDRGNNLHLATFHGKYDPTGAKLLQLTVTTNVSAI